MSGGLVTPKLRKVVGGSWATGFEARAEKRLAAIRDQHKAEIAELIRGWNRRLDAITERSYS